MGFDDKTLEKLAELICGDKLAEELWGEEDYNECPCYRKGYELPIFFHDAGLECQEFGRDTRKWWVLDHLKEYNTDSSINKVLLRLANPKEYHDQNVNDEIIKRMNELLALEGLKIILEGIEPSVVNLDPYIPSKESKNDSEIYSPDFNKIISNEKLCNVLELRWDEIKLCLSFGAYLSTIILMGSILEGALLSIVEKNPKEANTSKVAPKEKSGKILSFKKWTLNDLINVAHDCGWMDKDIKDFNSSLRDYRNLVHPRKQRDDEVFPDKDTCNICLHVVYAALNDLEKINGD
ncbi:MAG: hypothetical protein ACPK7O_06225 [Methanobacterium sp.]